VISVASSMREETTRGGRRERGGGGTCGVLVTVNISNKLLSTLPPNMISLPWPGPCQCPHRGPIPSRVDGRRAKTHEAWRMMLPQLLSRLRLCGLLEGVIDLLVEVLGGLPLLLLISRPGSSGRNSTGPWVHGGGRIGGAIVRLSEVFPSHHYGG
jgi:hypothetical protein